MKVLYCGSYQAHVLWLPRYSIECQFACEPAVVFSNRMSTVSRVSGVSGVSGVSDKFESRRLTVSRVSTVSAGAVNYSTVGFLLRRDWKPNIPRGPINRPLLLT